MACNKSVQELETDKADKSLTLTAGDGLTGGGTLEANRTFAVGAGTGIAVAADAVSVDVNGLTEETSIDPAADFIPVYDTSAGALRKAKPNDILTSGTYTPTLTNVANLDSSTAFQCQYLRVGRVVTVSGVVTVDPTTAAGTITRLGISLPIASSLTGSQHLGGTAVSDSVASESAAVEGDATNDRAEMRWRTNTTASNNMWFTFTYLVL